MREMPDLSIPSEEPDGALGWYALYTRHQHEKNVARALASKGFEVFLPLYSCCSPLERPSQAPFAPSLSLVTCSSAAHASAGWQS